MAQRLRRLPPMWETWVRSLGREDPLEKEMVTHSSILAWIIPWTEEPGKLQSMGSQRVGHNWVTSLTYLWFVCFNLVFVHCFNIKRVCSQDFYSKFSVLYSSTVYLNIFLICFQSWCFRGLSLLEQDARGECLEGAHPSGKISIPLWYFLIVDNHSWGIVLFLA